MVKKPIYWKEVFSKCNIQYIDATDDMSLKVNFYLNYKNYSNYLNSLNYLNN